jgi:uncharacterized protein YbaP (TraB family)
MRRRVLILAGLKKACVLLGALAAAACSTLQPAAAPKGPALWKVADADTIVYLFGTIHLLPEGQTWRTPVLEEAIAASDELVIETLIGDDPMGSAQRMMALGASPNLPPIVERVPRDKREALTKVISESGVPVAALDRLETWAAALTLTAVTFRRLGLSPELGVEKGLEGSYKAKARPVRGLETVEQQLRYFDGLSEDAQRSFLLGVLEDPAEAKKQFAAMLRTWSVGDVAGIARTFDAELKESPELRDALISRRNANWADWIGKRLDQPGTVMVAVGAGHLAGSESVQEMLRGRGIKATRIQ